MARRHLATASACNVMFGNVGLAERLAFSVFGSAVNEAALLETLTKKFATPIVASEVFTTYSVNGRRSAASPCAVSKPPWPFSDRSKRSTKQRLPQVASRNRERDFSDAEAPNVRQRWH